MKFQVENFVKGDKVSKKSKQSMGNLWFVFLFLFVFTISESFNVDTE